MKCDDREPELVMTLQDEHYAVAFFDTERPEVIGCLAGISLDILECEGALVFIDIDIYHRCLIRTFLSHSVHDVISEVEFVLIFKVYCAEDTFIIRLALDESLGNRVKKPGFIDVCDVMLSAPFGGITKAYISQSSPPSATSSWGIELS